MMVNLSVTSSSYCVYQNKARRGTIQLLNVYYLGKCSSIATLGRLFYLLHQSTTLIIHMKRGASVKAFKKG